MATNVLGKVYETLLCSPGMNEAVKIDIKVDRKTILLLSNVIESGLNKENVQAAEMLELIPKQSVDELRQFAEDCLNRAGLKELDEKIKALALGK